MNVLIKLMIVCALIFGLSIPVFAAKDEDKSAKSEKQEKSVAKETNAGKSEKGGAAETADKKENNEGRNVIKTELKEITGQVSAISKDYVAVIYQTGKNSENEMGIYIEGTPELERVKDLGQIQAGDTVTVEYDKVSEKDKEDNEFARHVVKKIIFVKKAPPPPPETNVLTSEESGQ